MPIKIIGPLLVVLLTIIAWMGYDMWNLAAREELWGWRPFFLLFAGWWFVVLLRASWGCDYDWKGLGLATLSAVLLSIGFPGITPIPIFAFVGFIPLLILVDRYEERWKHNRKLWSKAYHAFLGYNILTTWWVANSALLAGMFANFTNALLMTIPFMLFVWVKRHQPRLKYIAFVAFWIAFEYTHMQWDLSWPWLTLGNGFAQQPAMVQWYEYTGVFGGSLWILVSNILGYELWKFYKEKGQINRQQSIKWAALLVLPIVFSLVRYATYEEVGRTAKVAVVQPNYEPHYQKFSIPTEIQVDNFLALSQSIIDEETDFLVFPETSFPYIRDDRFGRSPVLNQFRDLMKPYPNLRLITGINSFHDFKKGEELTAYARPHRNGKGNYEVYNAAIEVTINKDTTPIHKKVKLVPGPEIFPFKKLFFFMKPLVELVGGTTAGLAIETSPVIFKGETGNIVPAICYESVYGDFLTTYFRQGGEAGFIMTNDGWWDDSPGFRQHKYFASLRAIENRRDFVRSANTGSSAFINQRGDITMSTAYEVKDAIASTIHLNSDYTFYTKWGDLIARVSLLLSGLLILNGIAKRFQPK